MIKRFSVLYVGQVELENVGLEGTPADSLVGRGGSGQAITERHGNHLTIVVNCPLNPGEDSGSRAASAVAKDFPDKDGRV